MTKPRRAIAYGVLLSSALPGWISVQEGSTERSAPASTVNVAPDLVATDLQVQSSVLRIEFDHDLHSRVVALFGSNPKPLAPFSASETVTGIRTWSNFALSASHRERVADAFGAGERQSLTGKSGDLRQDISVTIYADFPSIARVAHLQRQNAIARANISEIFTT